MKKKFLKFGLIFAGLAGIIVPTSVVLTSCKKIVKNIGVGVTEYTTRGQYTAPSTPKPSIRSLALNANETTNETKPALILDPNVNEDAIKKAIGTFSKISVSQLQTDFDKVLTKFYQVYKFEYKDDNGDETEAKVKSIKVKEIKKFDEKTGIGQVEVDVIFRVNEKKENRKSKDKDDDKEIWFDSKPQPKTFTLKPTFATLTQLEATKKLLENKDDAEYGDHEIDLEDLYELYVGDKDDNELSIFEQIDAINENTSKLGGLLGYSIKLSEIEYKDPEKLSNKSKDENVETAKKEFFAPSFTIRDFYIPSDVNKNLDLSLNLEHIGQKTFSELKSSLENNASTSNGNTSQDNNNINNFLQLLAVENTRNALKDKIQSINVNVLNVNNQGGGDSTTPPTQSLFNGVTDSKINFLNEKALEIVVQLNKENDNILGPNTPQIFTLLILESWCKSNDTSGGDSSI